MPGNPPAYTAVHDFSALIQQLDKVTQAWLKLGFAEAKVDKITSEWVEGVNKVITTLKTATKQGDEFAVTMDSLNQKLKITPTGRNIFTQAKEEAQAAARAAQILATSQQMGRYLQRNVPDDIRKSLDFKNQIGALKQFIRENELSAARVKQIWRDVQIGNFKAYDKGTALYGLQNQLAKLHKTITPITEETKKAAKAVDHFILRWESLLRIVVIHTLYRAMATITSQIEQSVQSAIELKIALAEVMTIDTGKSSLLAWEQAVRRLSDFFGTDLADQIESAYEALSNQVVQTTDEFIQFGEAINKFAIVTKSSTADSINLLSSVINAMGYTLAETDYIAATLFRTIDLGRVRANELANTFGNVLVPGRQLGVTLEEIEAAISLMTIRGVKYTEAATFMRNIFHKLIRPSEDMKRLFAEIGVASGEAAIQTYGFTQFLRILEEKTRGTSDELGELFQRIRPVQGLLMFNTSGMKEYENNLKEITEATIDYQRAFELVMGNVGKKFQVEFTQIANYFKQDVGGSILSTLAALSGGVENLDLAVKSITKSLLEFGAAGAIFYSLKNIFGALSTIGTSLASIFKFVKIGTIIFAIAEGIDLIYKYVTRVSRALDDVDAKMEKWNAEQAKLNRELDYTISKLLLAYRQASGDVSKAYLQSLAELNQSIFSTYQEAEKILKDHKKAQTRDWGEIKKAVETAISDIEKQITKYTDAIESIQKTLEDLDKLRSGSIFDLLFKGVDDPVIKVAMINEQLKFLRLRLNEAVAAFDEKKSIDIFDEMVKLIQERDKLDNNHFANAQDINKLYDEREQVLNNILLNHKQVVDVNETIKRQLEDQKEIYNELWDAVSSFSIGDVLGITDPNQEQVALSLIDAQLERLREFKALQIQFGRDTKNQDTNIRILESIRESKIKELEAKRLQEAYTKAQTNLNDAIKTYHEVSAQTQDIAALQMKTAGVLKALPTELTTVRLAESSSAKAGFPIYLPEKSELDKPYQLALKRAAEILESKAIDTKSLEDLKKQLLTIFEVLKKSGFPGTTEERLSTVFDELLTKINKLALQQAEIPLNADKQLELVAFNQAKLDAIREGIEKLTGFAPSKTIQERQVEIENSILTVTTEIKNIIEARLGRKFAAGGSTDTLHALLTPGEFVVNRQSAKSFYTQLQSINAGHLPRFAEGGPVNLNTTINVNESKSPTLTARAVAAELNRAARAGLVRLR